MFQIKRDPSNRELYTVLGYNYSYCSIMSVDMDVVGIMAAYLRIVRVCTTQCREGLCVYCTV